MRLACKFTFFSPNALRFARFFCVRQRHAHDFSLFPPLCAPPLRESVRLRCRLCRTTPTTVLKTGRFRFLLFSFFLSLSLPQGGGFFFEGLNNSFSITSSLFYYIYGVGRTHPVYICPCRGVAFGAHLPKVEKRIAPPPFFLYKCFLAVPSFAAKVAHFSEKTADFPYEASHASTCPVEEGRAAVSSGQTSAPTPQETLIGKRHSSVSLFPNTPTSMILQIRRWGAYRRKSTVVSNSN